VLLLIVLSVIIFVSSLTLLPPDRTLGR